MVRVGRAQPHTTLNHKVLAFFGNLQMIRLKPLLDGSLPRGKKLTVNTLVTILDLGD